VNVEKDDAARRNGEVRDEGEKRGSLSGADVEKDDTARTNGEERDGEQKRGSGRRGATIEGIVGATSPDRPRVNGTAGRFVAVDMHPAWAASALLRR
jgi:hypothetical protein